METIIDKAKELNTTVKLINDKLHFTGTVGDNHPVSIDYTPPLGDNLGYTSLELLLLSLSSCAGSSILTFLRKMRKTINGMEISAKGTRRAEHPLCFSKIDLEIKLHSPDATDEDMTKVISLSEETYCPVWAMLKNSTPVSVVFTITR